MLLCCRDLLVELLCQGRGIEVGFDAVWYVSLELVEAGVASDDVVAGEPSEDGSACCGAVGVAMTVDELSSEAGEARLSLRK